MKFNYYSDTCSVNEMAKSEQRFLRSDSQTNTSTAKPKSAINQFISENKLILVTLSGVILGILLGFMLRPLALPADTIMLIAYPGELFMRVLKLMILPLVIASLISGSSSLNAKLNGKIAIRTFAYFALTSFLNAVLGITLVLLIHPGDPKLHEAIAEQSASGGKTVTLMDSILDLGRNIFPDNIFQAALQQAHTVYVPKDISNNGSSIFSMVNTQQTKPTAHNAFNWDDEEELIRIVEYRPGTNTLGIVFFCLVFGTLLGTIGSKGYVVIQFFSAIFDVIMKMVTGVMWLTPVGIGSVIAGKILAVNDITLVMTQLAWFIFTIAFGVLLYQWVIIQCIYFAFLRKNPFKFYLALIQPMLTAFATASTAAALPLTFRCMNEKLKVDSRITRFVLPIGANINMDGTALFISVASIFIAQMSNMALNCGQILTVLLTSTAASMSSASIPSAALVLLLVVLTAIDAPIQNVTLLFAVDWLVDRIRTTNNFLGDCYCAVIVEHLSKRELALTDPDPEASGEDDELTLDAEGKVSNSRV
ncbi:excitatory amino acid transporter isoform X2 [Toxorhynchites rutilus septentrionalis]|uniref:excitatory amino acid transporter isoform X2 n=1 Tax=Toxorhynchites rutilus septentrionalis TaxID=329112 RepID=UPI002478B9FA|nr:excitatory amino acid transporter isoform X2 [Toxorhynchites rutilus septentrionalis]